MIIDEYLKDFPYVEIESETFMANTVNFTDYVFDDANMLFVSAFGKLPSSVTFTCIVEHTSKILDIFRTAEFGYIRLNEDFDVDNAYNFCLINKSNSILARLIFSKSEEDTDDDDEFEFESNYIFDNYNKKIARQVIELKYIPSENANLLIDKLKEYQWVEEEETDEECTVHLFEKDAKGNLRLVPHNIQRFELDLDKHYNSDFIAVDKLVNEWIGNYSLKNKRLVMFSGAPGTGKTNYIKSLMHNNSKLRKIYIPPYYVDAIADPGFFGFIKKYTNSVIIIEDAEKVLVSRDLNAGNTAMSALLNLTDGILASVLNFKVIVTFNTDEKEIDNALTRKGRLYLKYRFGKLSKEKTYNLFQELYQKNPPHDEMVIADIFENEDNGAAKPAENRMGFGI